MSGKRQSNPLDVSESDLKESNPDIREDIDEMLEDDEAAISMFASYGGARVSPGTTVGPSIGPLEERHMEKAVEAVEDAEKLKFGINTTGGSVGSAYTIANLIDGNFEEVEVIIPHYAFSGGTLISSVGDPMIMGDISKVGPLDPQITDSEGNSYSAQTMMNAYNVAKQEFSTLPEEDAPYPMKNASQFDPVTLQDARESLNEIEKYCSQILSNHDDVCRDNAEKVARHLVRNYDTHGHNITLDEAQYVFPDGMVVDAKEWDQDFDTFRKWLDEYSMPGRPNHAVRYVE